jgi:hypothetical protein
MSATHVIKGVVDSTSTKTVNTRFGDKTVYHVTVDGVEFSTGFKKLHSDGEMITVGVAWKYNNWQLEDGPMPSEAATAGGPGGSVTQMAPKSAGKGPGGFPVDPTSGQISIIRQNSMNRAVEIVNHMIVHGTITRPLDEQGYIKKLLEVALMITDFNSGQDIMQLKAAVAANKEVANG